MNTPPRDPASTVQLLELFRVIASGDVLRVSQLLADSPALAWEPTPIGATRAESAPFFIEAIKHYVYAGDTALHVAAAAHETSIAHQLLKRGAVVSARNRRGAEPLHYACDGSPGSTRWNPAAQRDTIVRLLAAGADANATDDSGVTPLHRAVRTRCAMAVRVLLENGADARQMNGSGSTPLHLAVQSTGRGDSGSDAAREQQAEIVGLLQALLHE